jgi:hypothetical protein
VKIVKVKLFNYISTNQKQNNMADFSKQYCQVNDMGFDGDFDVYEEWAKLTPGYGVPYICEGFGFTMIAKDETGDKVLVLVGKKWENFDDIYLEAKLKS